MKGGRGYLCPVPSQRCLGALVPVYGRGRGEVRVHGDPDGAFRCLARYLTSLGYERVGFGRRAWRFPGGPIYVLDKVPGFRLRPGKEGRYMTDPHAVGGGPLPVPTAQDLLTAALQAEVEDNPARVERFLDLAIKAEAVGR